MNKADLRKTYLAKQKELSVRERNAQSRLIAEQFFQNFDLSRARFLHCFLPIEKFGEIDTNLIFQRVWRDFPQIQSLVPRVNFQTFEMENLTLTAETALVENAWHIREPGGDELAETAKIDLVLAPLLCFDRKGFRVGYGKGFYDRFLKNCRADCLKIGLSFFAAVPEIADASEQDVKLDFCVTPEKVWSF